ncbi:mannonate dehydratase [Microvirga pudoricolor]|uniref:mannonate dehydratase n=1 Tax=Microvirga pudoricolor TaxID=2778729 RepID=UPI0019514874|nr:mannonate dehydratase [Microvirga pudoricolor]MBM6592877.1 mannonate dehydratase [Microvirga pudoricolor]
MEQTWRWWGPKDIISLAHVRQTGATGIVTALHDIPAGEVWTKEAIMERKRFIEDAPDLGLRWSVVESLPVAEPIKIGEGDLTELFDNYRESLRNLGACGVDTVCYNFMPVLDWARTDLAAPVAGGGRGLRFNQHEFAAFDCYILRRSGAEADYSEDVLRRAKVWFQSSDEEVRAKLLSNIMAGLPGAFDRYDVEGLKVILGRFKNVSTERLRENLKRFLDEVVPTAEEAGVRMAIHPDDPPWGLLGLPRIVGNEDDLAFIVGAHDSLSNGLTFCTGSLGANPKNDLPAMAARFAGRVNFVHLRNVTKDPDGSFAEAEHLGGDVDMVGVVSALLQEQKRRKDAGDPRWRLPFRPDHGHELLDDIGKPTHPGYPAIGRLRGLAEIRGVMTAVSQLQGLPV